MSEKLLGANEYNRALENIRISLAIALEALNGMNETTMNREQAQLLSTITNQQLQISLQLTNLEKFGYAARDIDRRIKTGELKSDPGTGKLKLADEENGK